MDVLNFIKSSLQGIKKQLGFEEEPQYSPLVTRNAPTPPSFMQTTQQRVTDSFDSFREGLKPSMDRFQNVAQEKFYKPLAGSLSAFDSKLQSVRKYIKEDADRYVREQDAYRKQGVWAGKPLGVDREINRRVLAGEKLTPQEVQKLNASSIDLVAGVTSAPGQLAKGAKYVAGINKTRLGLSEKGDEVLESVRKSLEGIRGKPVTHNEVKEAAAKSEFLKKVVTREETVQSEAQMLASRNRMKILDEKIESALNAGKNPQVAIKALIDEARVVSSTASDWGGKLQSLKIDPSEVSTRTAVLKDLAKITKDSDELAKRAAQVDWNDARSVTKFYREYVKPTTWDVLTEFRYNNMLSSPKTQLRNVLGNTVQTFGIRPATKLLSGDIAGTAKYYGGALKSFGGAVDDFKKAFSGQVPVENLDLRRVDSGKLPGVLTIPTRLTGAMDKFFTRLITEGEVAAGKTVQEATNIADYSLFRSLFDPTNATGQGKFLSFMDKYLQQVDNFRNLPGGRWVVPFFRTPINIAKMGIEYSPAGVLTLPGTSGVRQKEQVAKMLIGSGISLMGWNLAQQDRLTWAAPSDPKARTLFYSSGKKPFSVRVGDTWVPINYLGPLATPMSLAAAWDWYANEAPSALTDSDAEKMGKSLLGVFRVWAQQTPFEGVEDIMDLLMNENPQGSWGSTAAFMASSVIPLSGLQRYISQVVDPIYRKPEGFVEGLEVGIPGLSQNLKPHEDMYGAPSQREPINALLPYDVGFARDQFAEGAYEGRMDQLQMNAVKNEMKKEMEEGSVSGVPTSDIEKLRLYAGTDEIVSMPNESLYDKAKKEDKMYAKVKEIINDTSLNLTPAQKQTLIEDMGLSYGKAQYYTLGKEDVAIKTAWILDRLQNKSPQEIAPYLSNLREDVAGSIVASDGVLKELEGMGLISESQRKALEDIKKVNGKTQYKSIGARRAKALNFPRPRYSLRRSTGSRLKIRAPKIDDIKPIQYGSTTKRIWQ